MFSSFHTATGDTHRHTYGFTFTTHSLSHNGFIIQTFKALKIADIVKQYHIIFIMSIRTFVNSFYIYILENLRSKLICLHWKFQDNIQTYRKFKLVLTLKVLLRVSTAEYCGTEKIWLWNKTHALTARNYFPRAKEGRRIRATTAV